MAQTDLFAYGIEEILRQKGKNLRRYLKFPAVRASVQLVKLSRQSTLLSN